MGVGMLRKKIVCTVLLLGALVGNAHAKSIVTVDDTLRHAFSYSPNIKAAKESRQQAVHDVRVAEAGYYPTIGIWGGIGIQQSDDVNTRITKSDDVVIGTGNAGLQLSQTIWRGGYTSSRVRVQNEILAQRGWLIMDSANSLAYSAITAHADVLRRRKLVELAEENVKEVENILRTLRTRFAQGLSSQGDLDLVLSRLSRAKATLSQHVQGLSAAHATYTMVTGQPVPKELAPLSPPSRIYANEDEAREVCVSKNSRIKADLAAIRSAVADKDVVRAGFAPHFTVEGGPQFTDNAYNDDTSTLSWSAMLNMRWDIFTGGSEVANLKSRAAKVRELRQTLHRTMDEINQELITTYSYTKNAKEQAEHYKSGAMSSRKSKRNYAQQFSVGQRDLLSVLDAEGEYFFSVVEYEVLKVDVLLGSYRLLALTGDIIEEVNVNTASLLAPTMGQPSETVLWNFGAEQIDEQEVLKGSTLTNK